MQKPQQTPPPNSKPFTRVPDVPNDSFRKSWVVSQISMLSDSVNQLSLLDVGAGESPFRAACDELGFRYFSSDFGEFQPSETFVGLKTPEWEYAPSDFQCDVLDIPETSQFDVILCTEVLEHLPNPALAFAKLTRLCRDGGTIIVTVPLSSLIHQAPYYFSAGLSPWWFEHHSNIHRLKLLEMIVTGDYADVMSQEICRILDGGRWNKSALRRTLREPLKFLLSARRIRKMCSPALLSSSGFSVFFVATKA